VFEKGKDRVPYMGWKTEGKGYMNQLDDDVPLARGSEHLMDRVSPGGSRADAPHDPPELCIHADPTIMKRILLWRRLPYALHFQSCIAGAQRLPSIEPRRNYTGKPYALDEYPVPASVVSLRSEVLELYEIVPGGENLQ